MSGASELVWRQLDDLAARGHELTLVAERLKAGRAGPAACRSRRLRRWPLPGYWARRAFAARAARRLLDQALVIGHGDLLHQDCLFLHNLVERELRLLGREAEIAGHPVARFHRDLLTRGHYRLLIANSAAMRDALIKDHGVEPARIRVAWPGHDPGRFNATDRAALRAATRRSLGLDGEFLLGFVTSGNFPLRGADLLPAILEALPASARDGLRLLAVGAKHNLRRLHETLARHGLAALLLTADKIPEVQRYYHALDLLLHPARLETFGLVVLEAAACGTPVLTTTAVGAAELFSPDDVLPGPPEPGALAQRLAQLREQPEALRSLAARQQAAAARRDWQAWADEAHAHMEAAGLIAPGHAGESVR